MFKSVRNELVFYVVFLCLICVPSTGSPATWYVRTDGGTNTQCNGKVNAAYPGSGTNQPCAVNHPFWVLPPGRTPIIQGGDTLIIGQGSYRIGMDAPNTVGQTSVCYSAWTYDCAMPAIPSGPDAAHPTRILGEGWDTKATAPPELFGVGRVWQVISLDNSSNVELRYLDITDHSSCIHNSPDPAKRCNRSSAPFGDHGDLGIAASDSANVLIRDVNIHGMSIGGIKAGRLTDWTLEGVTIRGNGFVGWDGDIGHGANGSGSDSSNSGTMLFRNTKIEYSGCGETYPGKQIYGCFSQGQGGYGDGLGTYATGGNWIFENSEFSHNTSDGLDLLYHSGDGAIIFRNSRAEGNAGNAIKTATNTSVENSILISNCDYFQNNPITETASPGFDNCRAGGTTWATAGWKPGRLNTITNSLVTGTSSILIEAGGATCDGTEKFVSRNNIFLGMEGWYNKTHSAPGVTSDLFYKNGIDGNGSGPCGPSNPATSIKLDNGDSIAYNLKKNQCPNSSNVLCIDPQLTSIPPLAGAAAIYTYGEKWDVMPKAESPAIRKTSLLPGALVVGQIKVPNYDMRNLLRPKTKITWGPLEYDAITPLPAPANLRIKDK